MTVMIWALPAIIVLIGAIKSGATIFAAAFVVTLSSVRLMPMVVALVPEMRTPRTRPWVLYLLSHFVAVTSWVMAFQHFPGVPRSSAPPSMPAWPHGCCASIWRSWPSSTLSPVTCRLWFRPASCC